MSYEIIKDNFERRLWSEKMVRIAVKKGVITKKQFTEITQKAY